MWKSLRTRFESTDAFVSLILGLAVVLVLGMLVFRLLENKGVVKTPTVTKETKQEQTKETTQTGTMQENSYTVKEGDTLWSIADAKYKNGYRWTDIAKANNLTNPDALVVGQKLNLPVLKDSQGQIASGISTDGKPKQSSYTVVQGDCLWTIAGRMYDDSYKWPVIWKANSVITNPDLIYPGQVYQLP